MDLGDLYRLNDIEEEIDKLKKKVNLIESLLKDKKN